MSLIVRLGRRNAIYLPRQVVEKLKLREGDKLIVELRDREIILKPLPRFFDEEIEYWSSTSVEEFERESEELVDHAEKD